MNKNNPNGLFGFDIDDKDLESFREMKRSDDNFAIGIYIFLLLAFSPIIYGFIIKCLMN